MGRLEPAEAKEYLQEQIITYLGNKRKLLPLIGRGVSAVKEALGKGTLSCYDAFSGSGIVSRYLKQHASVLHCNDLEPYAAVLNRCYLANKAEVEAADLPRRFHRFRQELQRRMHPGLIAELYAPQDDVHIQSGERVFYTRRNAIYLDTARQLIGEMPPPVQDFFLAPLLYLASVHTNTSGVFKGFHKNAHGMGQFGGRGRHALNRIMAEMELPLPLFSRFDCEFHVHTGDAQETAMSLPGEVDVAYLDPPYNQHPYGSNYFMLNLLVDYERPAAISRVSGIPADWRHSDYNNKKHAAEALRRLLATLPARYALLSYNSEGHLGIDELRDIAAEHWYWDMLEQDYATYRGCRNLRARSLQVKEYLFILKHR